MKMKEIQDIFARLNRELENADDVDAGAQEQMQDLNEQVNQLQRTKRSDVEFLLDQAKALESRFAAEHPTLARIARELVDAVAKMGV